MGRHVNYADEQDRWLNKADKINRKFKSQSLEDRDPGSLTLAEQFELLKRRKEEQRRLKEEQLANPKKEEARFSHYRPK
jgi:hypothetical protein